MSFGVSPVNYSDSDSDSDRSPPAWLPFCGSQANRIAPDVMPQKAASHLGLFCLHRENFIEKTLNIPINESGASPNDNDGTIYLIIVSSPSR